MFHPQNLSNRKVESATPFLRLAVNEETWDRFN